ncbi:MAG: preprotein translocase subunit YajC, partial [[Eubacterium] siraeum]|nr:preprotein translocase subunit YajC [[Eubacterium] siraeum]
MLYNLLAADSGDTKSQIIMWVIIAVVIVLMVVLTIIPQRKRRKEQEKMMSSLAVGTKLMTVGGLVGRITQVNNDNTLIINVGTESNPTLIVIDKKAVGYVLENVNAPAPVPAPEATPLVPETPAVADE